MKALTFEEWKLESEYKNEWEKFDLARQGMIEESFIGFKQKEDWPHGAKAFVTYFTDKPRMEAAAPWSANPIGAFTYVRLEAEPAWAPKVGEAVFFCDADALLKVKMIDKSPGGSPVYVLSNGWRATILDLKPGSVDKIGKPWEEI